MQFIHALAGDKMKKSYSLLKIQVDRLYNMPLGSKELLHERIRLIESLIESCGWDVDQFLYYAEEDAVRN